jgi:hypothetical protein
MANKQKGRRRVSAAFFGMVVWLDKVREQRDQNDDRDRNAKQPKDDAFTHNCVSLCKFNASSGELKEQRSHSGKGAADSRFKRLSCRGALLVFLPSV